ncbi:MAG: ISL3 family transposase, partial [Planctomycetes bacterium]|nr:ISL3 family transposase [Planctomycetota bacterium]
MALTTRRRGEPQLLQDAPPKHTKYVWAQNPENMPRERRVSFELLRDCALKVGRAWAIKDA